MIFAAPLTFCTPVDTSSTPPTMDAKNPNALGEKQFGDASPRDSNDDHESLATGQNTLHRELRGRHMQMIAM